MSNTELDRKLSLRRAEISLNNFNAIAVPHHLDLLNKHRENIIKYRTLGDSDRIKHEHINATRVIVQIKHLVEEMDILRRQICLKDLIKFDQLTEKSRQLTVSAINEYLEMSHHNNTIKTPSISSGYSSQSINTDRNNFNSEDNNQEDTQSSSDLQNLEEIQLIETDESCLDTWENLQEEIQELHELFVKFNEVVKAQAEPVNIVEQQCEVADIHVDEGTSILMRAERYNSKWYPIAGAVVGGIIAGPIGLFTGLKVGSLAFIGGSALGFTGGRIIKKKKESSHV